MPAQDRTRPVDRIAISLSEARLEHGLSQRQLAALSGLSASTIRRIERGGRADAALLVQFGTVLVVLEFSECRASRTFSPRWSRSDSCSFPVRGGRHEQ